MGSVRIRMRDGMKHRVKVFDNYHATKMVRLKLDRRLEKALAAHERLVHTLATTEVGYQEKLPTLPPFRFLTP